MAPVGMERKGDAVPGMDYSAHSALAARVEGEGKREGMGASPGDQTGLLSGWCTLLLTWNGSCRLMLAALCLVPGTE